MQAPAFWWKKPGAAAALLSPVAAIYGAVAARRLAQPGAHAGIPVICIGNGRVLPAGPLRAEIDAQLDHAQAILIVGEVSGAAPLVIAARERGLPLFHATLVPDPAGVAGLAGAKVLAFAGIGDPAKFFTTIAEVGIEAPIHRAFGDHHRYRADEAGALINEAERNGLTLLTTEKDLARVQGDARVANLGARARALRVDLKIIEQADFRRLVLAVRA